MIEALVLAGLVTGATPLERCQAESQALNTARAIATCTAAGDDASLPKADRVTALRLLGTALIIEGDGDLAEDAFRRMLTLDPAAVLGPDAGPNVQKVYERAKEKLAQAPPKPPPSPPPAPPPPPENPTAGVGLTLVGVGGAVALVSGVVVAGAVYDRYWNRVPCAASASGCVPFSPMLFGVYPAPKRAQFFADSGAWISAGLAAVAVGAGAAAAGAFLAGSGPE